MARYDQARGLLRALGLTDEAASPSYPIVIPYDAAALRLPVAHVDLYRVEQPGEVVELGLDEYLADGALLIEWPERLGAQGWPGALALHLSDDGAGRRLTAEVPAAWTARWPFQ